MSRTVVEFKYNENTEDVVTKWADSESFTLESKSDDIYRFRKGAGFWVAPTMLEIRQAGSDVHLEAWIAMSIFARLAALFLVPSEMGIESGGFRAVIPRTTARTAVNRLLEGLGQAGIQ